MKKFIKIIEDNQEPVLIGNADVNGLVQLLPQVTNPVLLSSAINKMKQPDYQLTIQEKTQFALAFISLLGLSQDQKQEVMTKLYALTTKEEPSTTNDS